MQIGLFFYMFLSAFLSEILRTYKCTEGEWEGKGILTIDTSSLLLVCECVLVYHGLHILISKSLKRVFIFQDMKTQKIKKQYSYMFSTKQKRNENTITFNFTLIIHTDIFLKRKTCVPHFCNIDAFVIIFIFSFIHSGRHNENHR